jgi:hypothetical protein
MGANATFVVVRVGDGAAALSNASTAVFLEERNTSDGSLVVSAQNPLALPIAASGSNQPLTMSGTATSEGGLSLSQDGKYLVLAGYAAAPGVGSISSSNSAMTNRVVGRVDAMGAINTSTLFDAAFSANNVRGATSADGTSFWVVGNGSATTGGVWYTVLGATGGTQIQSAPANVRNVNVFGGQVYADSGSNNFASVFTVGSGMPTMAGQMATMLPGLPTTAASPYGFTLLDRDPNVAGVDTLYLSDDRAIASGGGISKWTFNGTTWTQAATFNNGLTTGVRGLTAFVTGTTVTIVATTTETSQNKIFVVVDDGSMNPMGNIVATAPQNEVFRGVAQNPM